MTPTETRKVPEVTLAFWAIKVVATTLGEVGGNAVTLTLGLGYDRADPGEALPPVPVLVRHHRDDTGGPGVGRLLRPVIGHRLSRWIAHVFALVPASLGFWYRSEGTVALETVATPRVEGLDWLTIMFSQMLGTALGDWKADDTPLGYNGSALLIRAALAVTAILSFRTQVSGTALFWAAFILTRPLGATVANSLDKRAAQGGLGVGDLTISTVLAALMVACVLLVPQRAGH